MRQFIGGDGSDTTAAVESYLESQRQLLLADLVLIGELTDPDAVWLTNWNSPLNWPVWGTFQAAVITRGKITSQIGLQVDSLEFTWAPPPGSLGDSLTSANSYQKAQSGFFDNKTFRLWRAVMPTAGDVDTYGACEYFGGRIAETKVKRGKITFTVNSFLDVVNQQIPPNVIESQNTLANYAGATPVLSDGETTIPTFEVVAPSNAQVITARCLGPTADKIYGDEKFQYGYIVFETGSSLAGYFSQIAHNGFYRVPGDADYNQFVVYQYFPWSPQVGDQFYASIQPPQNDTDTNSYFGFRGFKYVPQPEGAV